MVEVDLMPRTFYVHLMVGGELVTASSCKDACKASFQLVREGGAVVEVSCLRRERAAKVRAEACVWHMSALPTVLDELLTVSFS